MHQVHPEDESERWPAFLTLLAVGGLYSALPSWLVLGERWLLLIVVVILLVPTVVSHHKGHHLLNQRLSYLINAVVTLALVYSVAVLVTALPAHKEAPQALLRSATALWVTNILVFALWYWRLDAGGPHQRDIRVGHVDGAFLFPQMQMDKAQKEAADEVDWSPGFFDYLFLAFNTSTAFSPTDTMVLSGWAKVLMMIQSLISLVVIALLAARAVNIL